MTDTSSEGQVRAPDGVRLSMQLLGRGERALVVPGIGADADFAALTRAGRVAFYDVRNRGRSGPVDARGDVGLPVEVDDVDTVRAAAGFETTSVLGWSYVGLVVALYAATFSNRVERLVMVCPVAPSRAFESDRDAALDAEIGARLSALGETGLADADPVAFARAWRSIVTPTRMGNPNAFELLESDPSIWPNEWPDHMMEALTRVASTFPAEYDYRSQARSILAPTLIIHGEADSIPLEASEAWTRAIPDARLLVLPGVGHFPHVEAKAVFFDAVDTFLRGVWPPDAAPA